MKLYYGAESRNSWKIRILLDQLAVRYEQVTVELLAWEHKNKGLLRLGTIGPAIVGIIMSHYSIDLVFLTFACVLCVGGLICFFFSLESKGRILEGALALALPTRLQRPATASE